MCCSSSRVSTMGVEVFGVKYGPPSLTDDSMDTQPNASPSCTPTHPPPHPPPTPSHQNPQVAPFPFLESRMGRKRPRQEEVAMGQQQHTLHHQGPPPAIPPPAPSLQQQPPQPPQPGQPACTSARRRRHTDDAGAAGPPPITRPRPKQRGHPRPPRSSRLFPTLMHALVVLVCLWPSHVDAALYSIGADEVRPFPLFCGPGGHALEPLLTPSPPIPIPPPIPGERVQGRPRQPGQDGRLLFQV